MILSHLEPKYARSKITKTLIADVKSLFRDDDILKASQDFFVSKLEEMEVDEGGQEAKM